MYLQKEYHTFDYDKKYNTHNHTITYDEKYAKIRLFFEKNQQTFFIVEYFEEIEKKNFLS